MTSACQGLGEPSLLQVPASVHMLVQGCASSSGGAVPAHGVMLCVRPWCWGCGAGVEVQQNPPGLTRGCRAPVTALCKSLVSRWLVAGDAELPTV